MKLLVSLGAVVITCSAAGTATAITGREIIDTAQRQNGLSTWRDRTLDATMESYSATLQRRREAVISEKTDPRGEHRLFMEFVGPTDVAGARFLHLSPRGARDQQWLWTPDARRVRRLPDAARDENFMGTDLSYRDLELLIRIQQWTDEESAATLVREEPIDAKVCHVVEIVPKNKEFPYSKYLLWFDTTDLLLWRVDVYDLDGRAFKRITLRDYARTSTYATALHAEIANLPHGTRTVFIVSNVRYDSDLPDDLFSVANVHRGQ